MRARALERAGDANAESVALRAVELAISEEGLTSEETLRCLHTVGIVLLRKATSEDSVRALGFLATAVEQSREMSVQLRREVLESAAIAAEACREHAAAIAFLQESISLQRQHGGAVGTTTLRALADNLVKAGRTREALPLCRELVAAAGTPARSFLVRCLLAECLMGESLQEEALNELYALRGFVPNGGDRANEIEGLIRRAEAAVRSRRP